MAAFSASGENFNPTTNPNREEQEEDYEKTYQNYNKMLQTLPKGKGWRNPHLVKYQNCWLNPNTGLKGVLLIQNHFKPKPTDTFLASFMKSGTTWLRSLLFATVNRTRYDFSSHPLLTTNPHSSSVFPFLDAYIYDKHPIADLDSLPSPRLFATHMPYALLPEPVTCTGSKFVYVWRDPKDVLVSKWLYMRRHRPKDLPPLTLHEAFELFCDGVSDYGPFWDHVLGYWNASLKLPGNILVLKYEEMKREPAVYVKRLAEFMEVPFSVEEEKGGVVEEIVELCSFDKLSNLEVNKTGVLRLNEHIVVPNRDFFRKGEIGDGKNYLTDEMIERLDCITKSKFDDADWAGDHHDRRSTISFVSILVLIWFRGVQRNSILWQDHPRKLSIELLLRLQLIFRGYSNFSLICLFLLTYLIRFGATIRLPLHWLLILCTMLAQSTLRSIITS